MKIFYLCLIMSLLTLTGIYGQIVVNDVNINNLNTSFCRIHTHEPLLSHQMTVCVDYGQPEGNRHHNRIQNANGENRSFNSLIDVMNFMEENGWIYLDSNVEVSDGNSDEFYLFRKKNQLQAHNN